MKGTLSGLKELKKVAEGSNRTGGSSFLSLKDGQSVTVRFVQEIDKAGKHYNDERGLAISVYEHTNPDDFSQRFLCTQGEEGRCYGCERVPVNPRWKRRSRLFINGFIKEENATKVIATGFSSKGIGGALLEYAEDFGTVGDRWYKLKRNGEGLKTSYTLYPRDVAEFDFNDVQTVDLENFTRYRTYEEVVALVKGEDTPQESDW
jgi:hypothetical protein